MNFKNILPLSDCLEGGAVKHEGNDVGLKFLSHVRIELCNFSITFMLQASKPLEQNKNTVHDLKTHVYAEYARTSTHVQESIYWLCIKSSTDPINQTHRVAQSDPQPLAPYLTPVH